MYFINDTKAAIKEIQIYLTYLADLIPDMPYTPIDGVYGDDTRSAVAFFQKNEGIVDNGTVNYETYVRLVNCYNERFKAYNEIKNTVNSDAYPLKRGDVGENVLRLNSMVKELSEYFDIPNLPHGDGYGQETVDSIMLFQRILGFEITGETDIPLERRLENELKNRENYTKAYKKL
jgi:peptidoglycan hydrolase-like protein with peptidoglycan-binding domain